MLNLCLGVFQSTMMNERDYRVYRWCGSHTLRRDSW